MSALHNSGINDIFTVLNTAWPLSVGLGVAGQIGSWDALTAKGTTIPSSSTLVLTTATGPRIDISGVTTITAVTLADGTMRFARATGIFQITASASLIVNKSTSVNYTTAVGDILIFQADGAVVSVTTLGVPNPLVLSGSTVSYTPLLLTSTDAGALAGPIVDLFRDSASPASNDILAELLFNGRDSAGNKQEYASLVATIGSPTSTTEIGTLGVWTFVNGVRTEVFRFRNGIFVPSAGGDMGAGTINTAGYYLNGSYGVITLGTSVPSTSGSSIDFTGIPAGAKRITINFIGVSTTGAAVPLVQLGDSGGLETTGYLGAGTTLNNAGAVAGVNYTTGFGLAGAWSAAAVLHGTITLTLESAANNTWAAGSVISRSDAATSNITSGRKSTSATLDRVSIVTTDAFDAGEINITIE